MRCKKCGYVFFEETSVCPKCDAEIDMDDNEETMPLFIEDETSTQKNSTKSSIEVPLEKEPAKFEKRILISAPLGIRAMASGIDILIAFFISLLTTWIPYYLAGGSSISSPQILFWSIIFFLETILYFSLSHYLIKSSIGKSIFEIEVSAYDKELSFGLCLLKSLLGFLLTLPLFLTWIYTFVNEDEVPLHDALLGVLSVEKE